MISVTIHSVTADGWTQNLKKCGSSITHFSVYTLKIYTTQAMMIQISLIYFILYMKWSRDQNKIMYISSV